MEDYFIMADEGSVEDYLKVNAERNQVLIHLARPFFIQSILEAIGGMENSNVKATSAQYTQILYKDLDDSSLKQKWSYRSSAGMLNYLVSYTRPDLIYAVHQCARFTANPILSTKQGTKEIHKFQICAKA